MMEKLVLPVVLAMLMFGLGLALCFSDFRRVGRKWPVVVLALLSILVFMPLCAFALGHLLELPLGYAAGLILLATCPGGMFSNMVAHGSKADLPLSLALTVCSSVLYVLMAPWLLLEFFDASHGAGTWAQPVAFMTGELVGVVLFPLAAGMFVRYRWSAWATRYAPRARTMSVVLIALVFVSLAAEQFEKLAATGGRVVLAVLMLNAVGWVLAALLAAWRRLSTDELIAIGAEHSIRQEGIGVFVAVSLLARPEMAVPVLTNSFVGFAACLGAVSLVRWLRPKKPATQVTSSATSNLTGGHGVSRT
jgi:BASS family bile acid:Na+ symporter